MPSPLLPVAYSAWPRPPIRSSSTPPWRWSESARESSMNFRFPKSMIRRCGGSRISVTSTCLSCSPCGRYRERLAATHVRLRP
jgi:hypothetical protein